MQFDTYVANASLQTEIFFFILSFRIREVLTSKICYTALFSTAAGKIWRLLGWWGADDLWILEKHILWTGCWGWLRIVTAWVKICMDLQKLFPKTFIDWEILCNKSAKTRFDSYNIPANVLQSCASSFAFCNSSLSLRCRQDFSKCFRLLSIDLGTWFSSDLHFVDELCLIGSSSFTESL